MNKNERFIMSLNPQANYIKNNAYKRALLKFGSVTIRMSSTNSCLTYDSNPVATTPVHQLMLS